MRFMSCVFAALLCTTGLSQIDKSNALTLNSLSSAALAEAESQSTLNQDSQQVDVDDNDMDLAVDMDDEDDSAFVEEDALEEVDEDNEDLAEDEDEGTPKDKKKGRKGRKGRGVRLTPAERERLRHLSPAEAKRFEEFLRARRHHPRQRVVRSPLEAQLRRRRFEEWLKARRHPQVNKPKPRHPPQSKRQQLERQIAELERVRARIVKEKAEIKGSNLRRTQLLENSLKRIDELEHRIKAEEARIPHGFIEEEDEEVFASDE